MNAGVDSTRQYLENVLDAFAEALFITSVDGGIEQVNKPACAMLNRCRDEIVGSSIHDLVHDKVLLMNSEMLSRFTSGTARDMEISLLAGEGRQIPVLFSTSVVNDSQGGTGGILCVVKDTTGFVKKDRDTKDNNAVLSTALSKLKQAQGELVRHARLRALGEMASGIAHDFNSALMPIVGYTDMLLQNHEMLNDRPGLLTMLGEMSKASKSAVTAVRRLREFCRPATDDDRQVVRLQEVVSAAVAVTRPKWKEEKESKGITIGLTTEVADVPPVIANNFELKAMLGNLIFNAVDAMPGGGSIVIRVYTQGDDVVMQVSDNGVGMSEEERMRCFEPFFSTKKERSELGLSMAYGVVKRYGGFIDIASEPGKGTTVIIRFPADKRAAEIPKAAPGDVAPVPAQARQRQRPLNILVIDDEASARQFILRALRSAGHSVDTASGGQQGLAMFSGAPYDVVIVDRAMPDVNGDVVAREIKTAKPKCGVIMLTGFGQMMAASNEKPDGVDMVLSKPIWIKILHEAVNSCAAIA